MKVVTMSVGDLAYGDVLPAKEANEANLTSYHQLLRSRHGEFEFISHLPVSSETVGEALADDRDILHFPALSHILFICFSLLMPIVVLNVLVGY